VSMRRLVSAPVSADVSLAQPVLQLLLLLEQIGAQQGLQFSRAFDGLHLLHPQGFFLVLSAQSYLLSAAAPFSGFKAL